MRRLIVATLVITALLSAASAQAEIVSSPRTAAKALALGYVAPLVRPDFKPVSVRVLRCHALRSNWTACRVNVTGAVACSLVVHVRPDGPDYRAWVPSMKCSRRT